MRRSFAIHSVIFVGGFAFASLVAFAVAAAAEGEDVERVPFSHVEHQDTDASIKCADCHDATHTVRGRPTLKLTQCEQCHDEIPSILSRGPVAALAFVVDHKPHANVDCMSCHARQQRADDDVRTPEHTLTVTPAACLSCHANAKSERAPREQACVSCHGRDERRERPQTHATVGSTMWRQSHGARATMNAPGAPGIAHGQSCTLCHRESSCRACHRVEEPRDHSAVWSERTHGFAASMDQARCKTCHETGQCIGCHRATQPRNHTVAWSSTHGLVARSKSDTSCATCHRPSFCIDCHRGGR